MIRVAINGFGRIGRQAFKIWLDTPKHKGEMEIVAINDLVDAETLAHLLKYDSVYGEWKHTVSGEKITEVAEEGTQTGTITVEGIKIATYATREPENLPWGDLSVDVVIESTGRFTKYGEATKHLSAGAKKIVVSAPAKGTPTVLLGVNEEIYSGEAVVNNASCTTNCIAPVVKVIDEAFGVEKAMMTTVHAVTAEQNLVDGPPPGGKRGDLRRARAAYTSIIPTTTGAAIATTEALPALSGKFDGVALRVPVICGSISDITFLLSKKVSVEEVNEVLKKAADTQSYKGILSVIEDPIVSADIIGRPESAIVDLSLTQVVDGDMVKVFAWYDNEFGYSSRLIEQVISVGKSS